MRRPRIRGRKQTAKQLISAKIHFGNSSINALASENAFARECSPLWKGARTGWISRAVYGSGRPSLRSMPAKGSQMAAGGLSDISRNLIAIGAAMDGKELFAAA